MKENKQYSSHAVKALIENEKFRFASKNWEKEIIANWPKGIRKKSFFSDVRKIVGKDFVYERAINGEITHLITKKGLLKLNEIR